MPTERWISTAEAQNSSEIAACGGRSRHDPTGGQRDRRVRHRRPCATNLLGLPLDLAAINIARGRETGIPTLNDARAQFFAGTGDTKLKPYDSWFDFAGSTSSIRVLDHQLRGGLRSARRRSRTPRRSSSSALPPCRSSRVETQLKASDSLGNVYTLRAQPISRTRSTSSTSDRCLGRRRRRPGEQASTWSTSGSVASPRRSNRSAAYWARRSTSSSKSRWSDLQDGDRFYYLGRVAGSELPHPAGGKLVRGT